MKTVSIEDMQRDFDKLMAGVVGGMRLTLIDRDADDAVVLLSEREYREALKACGRDHYS